MHNMPIFGVPISFEACQEATAKLDVEAANGHRVDEELRSEVLTNVLMCLLLAV